MEKFFKLKKYGTNISTEVLAGLTTFFAMSYILIVNPSVLSAAGMPWGGVYLATILSAAIGTLIMGLYGNVPYAVAPGMGLNQFFALTVVKALGFSWQEALSMVFICGVFNVLITVTSVRKKIIAAIPENLQYAIGGGIGIFVAYLGFINAGVLHNVPASEAGSTALIPSLGSFTNPVLIVAMIGLVITIVLAVLNVKGSILIGIVATAIIGIPFGVTHLNGDIVSVKEAFQGLGTTFGAIFTKEGIPSLFSGGWDRLLIAAVTIFSFSLSDVFDTIGTFIGAGRSSGIFSQEEVDKMQETVGFETRLDRAMVADSVATSTGAILGTSNATTFVESAAGIGAGGRTGLASVVTALMFLICIFIAPLASVIPSAATAPALIVVGIMMLGSFGKINWEDLSEAIPCFFTSIFMGLSYSISYGIAFGFITYAIVKITKKEWKDLNPIIIVSSLLFIIYFIVMAKL